MWLQLEQDCGLLNCLLLSRSGSTPSISILKKFHQNIAGIFNNYLPKPEVNFSLSKQEVNYTDPEVIKYGEPEVKNNIEHLFEFEVKNHYESGINEDEEEDTNNCDKSLSRREFNEYTEPEVSNCSKSSGLELRNHNELVLELNADCNECPLNVENDNYLEVTNEDKPLSEPEVNIDGKPPSEPEPKFRDDGKPPSEPESKFRDDGKPPSEPESKFRDDGKLPSEPESKVRNEGKPPSEPDVRNYEESGKNEDEQEETFNGSKGISRLGILVRILVGFLEDLPVVISVYYPTVMPMCGIPAKQSAGSAITLATIVSSMLNSLWTMICLICELCGCSEGGFCCLGNKKDLNTNAKYTDRNPSEQNHRHETTRRDSKKHSKPCMKTVCKVVLCILIFILFSCTFTLGFWTVWSRSWIYFFKVYGSFPF